jgi:hypothetical protein
MGILIAHPESEEKSEALKAFLNAQEIRFEEEETPYDPEFVEKIKRSQKDFKAGRFKAVKIDDLWK